MSMNIKYLHGMFGGKDGGIRLVSPITAGTYDFIIVEAGVTLTVMEDNAAVNLLTAKGLGSFAFTAERIISAGTGKTIKKLTWTGGTIWGYTLETLTTI